MRILGFVVNELMFRLLDKLIDEAKTAIPAPGGDQAAALDPLKKIHDLLISHGFVYPPVGLTQLLSDGMTPRTVEGPELQRILNNPHNARRRATLWPTRQTPFTTLIATPRPSCTWRSPTNVTCRCTWSRCRRTILYAGTSAPLIT